MRKSRKVKAAAIVLSAALILGIMPGNGTYSYAEENKALLMGDVDNNGNLDANDALSILKYDVGIAQPVFAEEAADVDGNNTINANDALTILKYDVEIITEFPVSCTEHAWGDGTVIKKATLKEEGLIAYTCTKCGSVKQETVPVLEPCETHVWDNGNFIETYFTEDASGNSSYHTGWKLGVDQQSASGLKDILLDCIIFSSQAPDGDLINPGMPDEDFLITRPCEEGLKEYICRVCGETKTDFSVKKRTVPTEETAVSWVIDPTAEPYSSGWYLPAKSGWTGKKFWIQDKTYEWLELEYIDVSETIYNKEQEQALDEISARFVSGNIGLWEYEAAVREYLSGLNIFDTSKTKGELLIGCNIYFEDNMQSLFFAEPRPLTFWTVDNADGSWQELKLNDHPFQYIYLNSYYDKEKMHSTNFTISLYVKNPLLAN